MKSKQSILLFAVLIVVGALARVEGFAPQLALAVFAGAVIKDKKLAFILPLVSMFLSDLFFELKFIYGYSNYGGFYEGQLSNYIILAAITFLGFWARNLNWAPVTAASLAAPVAYFLLSNFVVWQGGGGLQRPKTFDGLMLCYNDALPFFRTSFEQSVVFAAIFFGSYFLVRSLRARTQLA